MEAEVAPRGAPRPRGAPKGPRGAPRGPRGGPRGPRAAAPRGGPRGPKPKEEEEKKGLKTTEQELEELQKRREPESIELYQLSKDSLIDLAKKADIINPSGMTKIQLIQALQKSGITKNDVSQLIIQNEIKNAPATEFAYLDDNALNAMDFIDLREYVKEIRKEMKNPAIPKIKFNGDTSRLGYIKAIFNWEKAKEALEESKEIRRDILEADEKSRVPGEAMSTNVRLRNAVIPARAMSAPEGERTPAPTPSLPLPSGGLSPSVAVPASAARLAAEQKDKPDKPEARSPPVPRRGRSLDTETNMDVLKAHREQLIKEDSAAAKEIPIRKNSKIETLIANIKKWYAKKPVPAPVDTQAQAPPATPYGVNAEQKGSDAKPELSFVSEGVDIAAPDQAGNQESKNARVFVTANANTNNLARVGDPGVQPPPAPAADGKLEGEGKHKKQEKFGIDNHSIDRFLSKYGDEYLGCIAHDEIPSKIYPKIKPRSRGFFVINTDPSWKSGEHWQCVFFDARPNGSNSIEFYDSFADPIDPKMQADLKGIAERLDAKTYLKLKENRIKQQHDDSDNCGYFCMNFITSRMRGKGFPEASGFDESVKGESDIHRFKKMNGFGFLPSFGSIASTFQRPLNTIKDIAKQGTTALQNTAQRVRNVGSTIGNIATNIKETIFFPEKKLPSSIQPLFEKYKNFKIISFQIRREPILAFVDKFINFISFGKFNEAKKNLGYDKMFHLSLILQLENGPKLLIEKNERINMTLNWKDGNQVQYFPASGSIPIPGNPTLGEFYDRTLKAVGDHQFFTYNAFAQNCQAFISDLLRSNNALSDDARNFVMQDAQTVIKQLPFYVSKIAQFSTDTAGRIRQFFGFGKEKISSKEMMRKQKYENFMRKYDKKII